MKIGWLGTGLTVTLALAACGPSDAVVQERVDGVLAHPDNGMTWASAAVTRGQVSVSGMAPSEEALASVAPLLAQIPGVKGVIDEMALDTAFVRRTGELSQCESGLASLASSGKVAFSGPTIVRASRAWLDEVATVLLGCPDASVELAGHTDSSGSDAANQAVSERRAQAVMSYLVTKGVGAERMTAVGYGEANPVADNATAAGRESNRRVEIILRN